MITYKEQFDKLTSAYIHNKVEPYHNCACFIGNLLNGGGWQHIRDSQSTRGDGTLWSIAQTYYWGSPSQERILSAAEFIQISSEGTYSDQQILDMENNFLRILFEETVKGGNQEDSMVLYIIVKEHPNYENALFNAFSSTLEILKQIHIEKGENVEGEFAFVKRELQVA